MYKICKFFINTSYQCGEGEILSLNWKQPFFIFCSMLLMYWCGKGEILSLSLNGKQIFFFFSKKTMWLMGLPGCELIFGKLVIQKHLSF